MLERHPERINAVRLAERRDDPRVREIEELARLNKRPVQRVHGHALMQMLADVTHQGVAADITPQPPETDAGRFAAPRPQRDQSLTAFARLHERLSLGA